MKIDLILPQYSRYKVLHLFTKYLAEGLTNAGATTRLLEIQREAPQEFLRSLLNDPPDFTLCFNGILPDEQGRFVSDMVQIPHVACLVDSPHYFLPLIKSKYSIITCVDRFGCDFFKSVNFHNALFMPHATSRSFLEASPPPDSDRPYDVVMMASYVDIEKIHGNWKSRYGEKLALAFEEAAEITLIEPKTPYAHALARALDSYAKRESFNPNTVDYIQLLTDLENYVRGKDRLELVKAIKDAEVHLFGENAHLWKQAIGNPSNVIVHDEVPYTQALEIMQKSKIVLNSSPFFKNGAHERIFTGTAAGAVVISNDSLYLREKFSEGESLLFYNYQDVNATINDILDQPVKRYDIVAKGRAKVLQEHTWDRRAEDLLKDLTPILKELI